MKHLLLLLTWGGTDRPRPAVPRERTRFGQDVHRMVSPRIRHPACSSDDNQNPVLVKEFANVARPGTWSWTWDGKLGDGSTAPRGIYLYRLSAYVPGSAPPDRDSNRSDSLAIVATEIDYDGDEMKWIATCHLNGAMRSGKVEAVATISLRVVSDGNGQPIEGGCRARVADFEANEGGPYVFLMRAWDTGDTDGTDKMHRRREALPCNQQVRDYPVALVGTSIGASSLRATWNAWERCPPFRRPGDGWYFRFTPPRGEQDALFLNVAAQEALYYLNETATGTRLWMAYTHGAQEAAFHGYGLQFAASWLWSHDQAPKPSGKVLAYRVHIANVSPHVMMTACWSGANHEDAKSLMGVLRGKGTANRVSWKRAITQAEGNVFYNGFTTSLRDQMRNTRYLDYGAAIKAGAEQVKDLIYRGKPLHSGFEVELPVMHNEQEVNTH
ncbi:MAG: hypothetical protein KatS3mg023_1490 [Armatimonadota bacterium]|nr:MAG: hypothetical protein KatS3mg023_1490 [Armatimonadota bacterium]